MFFEFHPSYCVVKSQASKEVLLKGKVGQDGLYHFPNLLQPSRKSAPATVSTPVNPTNLSSVSVVNIASTSDDSYSIWHSRLGHPSSEIFKNVLKLWSTSFLTSAEELASSLICVASASCCN